MLKVKRAYEGRQADDGTRILVDRLWPRGLSSNRAYIDEWAKNIAPSDELRRWFGHQPEKWLAFQQKYTEELSRPEKAELMARIARMAVEGNVTLIYSAKDSEHNNARVLEELVVKHIGNLSGAQKIKEEKMNAKLNPLVEFREDHRKVRDGLLDLASAAEAGDVTRAGKILGAIDTLVGPHFRYEEEALYPALKEFLGDYVDSLIKEHDGAIGTAKVAATLLSKPSLSQDEGKEVAKAARALLVHVSNCDGLNILAERFSPQKLDGLADHYAQSRAAGVPLLRWADTIRTRQG